MILPAETTTELNKLRDAINEKNVADFEAALEALVKQDQIQAINQFFDANGLNPLHLALSLNNPANGLDTARFVFHDLKVSYKNDDTYGQLPTLEKRKILQQIGIDAPKTPEYGDLVTVPHRLYFLWRLLSFNEINPNTKTMDPNQADNRPTALHRVIPLNDNACFALLMSRPDLCLNLAGASNERPIHTAVDCQNGYFVRALVERGANLNQRSYISGGNYKPLELATIRHNLNIIDTLLEFGAGIGAHLNVGDLITDISNNAVKARQCAFFGARNNNLNALVDNETPGLENSAISWPWEEKLIQSDLNPDQYIHAKPAFPYLKHYAHLQQRCFEIIKEDPYNNIENFKKLALYFGAHLESKTIHTKAEEQEVVDGVVTKKIVVKEKIVHGTLKSLAAYTLATNEDKHEDALNYHYEQLLKKKKNALAFEIPSKTEYANLSDKEKREILPKINLKVQKEHFDCEFAVYCANDLYKQVIKTFNVDDVQDKILLKRIFKRIDEQLERLSWDHFFNLFNNHDFQDIQTAALTILIWVAVIGAILFAFAFLLAFIIIASLTLPIFPALMFGLWTALVVVGPTFLAGLIVPVVMSAVSAAIETINYSIQSISIIKSLNELADEVQIMPSLMSEQTQHLLADLLDGRLDRGQLRNFITIYRAEIAEKLNSNFIDEVTLETHIPATAINWQFYPPKRENNVQIDEDFSDEKNAKEMGLFEGMTSAVA